MKPFWLLQRFGELPRAWNFFLIFTVLFSFLQFGQTLAYAQPVSAYQNLAFTYTLDRSAVPSLTYNDVTLKINIGNAGLVAAKADGQVIPIDKITPDGYAVVTTSASSLEVDLYQVTPSPTLGSYSIAVLKYDRQWAWSHSFDDDVYFKQYGIPAFEKYGWRAMFYLVGSKVSLTSGEMWNFDVSDIATYVKKGWGIGNHTWTHSYVSQIGVTAAQQEIIDTNNYFRQIIDAAGRPDYKLIAFAAPDFDSAYLPIIQNLRDTHTTQVQFDETSNRGFMWVDPGAAGDPVAMYPFIVFDYSGGVGRDWRIDALGTGSTDEQSFRADFARMISILDSTHHYWLNTFTHDVDSKYPNQSIFVFLPWIYSTYGPGGNNSVWVAPSDEIYSYLLVREHIKISMSSAPLVSQQLHNAYLPQLPR